ncbi:MAG: hypothetical protein J5641_02700 [Bacteroidales bacterium]|nr:hypothetical protein [Bacteroidales bacterium]
MKTKLFSLLALLLMAFQATAGNDDTLKVFRIKFYQKVEGVKLSGYCKVEIVNDSVEYLEYCDPQNLDRPKGLEYGLGGKKGQQLSLNAIPGVAPLRLHLVLESSVTLRTEDYAQVDVVCPQNLSVLTVSSEDYSKVTITAARGIDTLRARNIVLKAKDYSSIAMTVPCAMDNMVAKADDFAKVDIAYCKGDNLVTYEQDRAKVHVESFHVTSTEFSALYEDEDDDTDNLLDNLVQKRKEHKKWSSDDFMLDYLWGFTNWGTTPFNGLSRMDGAYLLHTSFSSYQLEGVYYPYVDCHWAFGLGLGYASDVFKFTNDYVTLGTTPAGETTFVVETPDAGEWSSRMVARYITLPLVIRCEPFNHSDFHFGVALIPGLNISNKHTGLKHEGEYVNGSFRNREDVSQVMNPFRLDVRLRAGWERIYFFFQVPTISMTMGMDKDVYPIKLGLALSLGED